MRLSDSDRAWLATEFPNLLPDGSSEHVYRGEIHISMVFNTATPGQFIINPSSAQTDQGNYIRDQYNIEIDFGTEDDSFPIVREIGGRIHKVATEQSLDISDLHINGTGDACLCFEYERKTALPNGLNIVDFFQRLVIPFFYAQSFYVQHGYWPWGQYSHGTLGMLEWYLGNSASDALSSLQSGISFLKRDKAFSWYSKQLWRNAPIKGHQVCPCGSKKRFRDCHPQAYKGLWKLHDDIWTLSRNNKLNLKQLKEILNAI